MTPERTAEQIHSGLTRIDITDITDVTEEEPQISYLDSGEPGPRAARGATDTIDSLDTTHSLDTIDTGADPLEALELEALELEALDEELDHHHAAAHGEALWVDERLVLSPASGRFWKEPEEAAPERGEFLLTGEVVGHVVAPDGKPIAVRSPFSGWAMGFLIPNGSPVKSSEPVLWLRTL